MTTLGRLYISYLCIIDYCYTYSASCSEIISWGNGKAFVCEESKKYKEIQNEFKCILNNPWHVCVCSSVRYSQACFSGWSTEPGSRRTRAVAHQLETPSVILLGCRRLTIMFLSKDFVSWYWSVGFLIWGGPNEVMYLTTFVWYSALSRCSRLSVSLWWVWVRAGDWFQGRCVKKDVWKT